MVSGGHDVPLAASLRASPASPSANVVLCTTRRLCGWALLMTLAACDRGCRTSQELRPLAKSLRALQGVDCPDGLARCEAGSVLVSRLTTLPSTCGKLAARLRMPVGHGRGVPGRVRRRGARARRGAAASDGSARRRVGRRGGRGDPLERLAAPVDRVRRRGRVPVHWRLGGRLPLGDSGGKLCSGLLSRRRVAAQRTVHSPRTRLRSSLFAVM